MPFLRLRHMAILLMTFGLTGPSFAQSDDASSAPAPKVSIAAAYTKEITEAAVFIGRAEAIDEVDIIARVNGFLEERAVLDGDRVEKDDLLFRIEKDLYEATLQARGADLDRAEANLELARLEYARKEELLKRGSVPESERDLARANELVAEAEAYQAEVVNRATGDASRFNQIFQAYLKDKDVTKERIYIETVEEIFSNVDKIIIDSDAGNGVVPYLPLKELNKSTGGN